MSEEQQQGVNASRSSAYRWIIVAALVIAVGAVMYLRAGRSGSTADIPDLDLTQETTAKPTESESTPNTALPRLVDLGADKCVPCKMMAPILKELRQEYAGRFEVVFIDVWKKPSEAKKYGIKVIPTQVFYDASGKELFRHQGFFSKEQILQTWQDHGIKFMQTSKDDKSS